ncbi:hypothetical protein N8T08_004753 [Aspergillus melleus]|uniref:Uncharacterized protein n=1 Tax=Aspergillus melleus TaxID=138277 RepID=A0ACC3B4A4_9EURO|nr:hypothetical protein N8T08_004753 [Aspergillus melleus]
MAHLHFLLALLASLVCLVSQAREHDQLVKRTGNTVRFEVVLTWEDWAPAGISRKMILTNGQFPAPTLDLRQGDDVEFLVINKLPTATTVHFHGIEQSATPWSDGVPGLSQTPIQPGDQFLYKWTATQYGSYFYHAHRRGQIEDGLYGAIYIQPQDTVEKPFKFITNNTNELRAIKAAEEKTRPVLLSDWRQLTSEALWHAEEAMGRDSFCANALLVNGKGNIGCPGVDFLNAHATVAMKQVLGNSSKVTDIGCMPPTLTSLQGNFPHNLSAIPPSVFSSCTPSQGQHERLLVNPTQKYTSFDLLSSAGVSTITFSIDEHPMYVYAIDGRYIVPTQVSAITISNGARYSVLVKLNKPAGDYTVRVANTGVNQLLNTTATMSYTAPLKTKKGPSNPQIDMTGAPLSKDATVLDESTIIPFPAIVPSEDVAATHILNIARYNASYRWIQGGSNSSYPLALEDASPLLYYPLTASEQKDLTISTQNNTWVDIVFAVTGPIQPPHPFHKHSNKFFVLGQGNGVWNYSTVAEAAQHMPENFNFVNPQIRDTFVTPPASTGPTWLAIRYHVVNPGAFLLHCHIQVHLSGGMGLAMLDGVDEWPEIPERYWETVMG